MSWKSDRAIERVVKLFKRAKSQIFDEDIKAIKTISETIEENEKKYVTDNMLYAKLLCYILNQNLHHHGSMKTAIKATNDIFKHPLNYHLQMLQKNLNDTDIYNYLESIGIEFGTYKNQDDILKQKEKEFLKRLQTNWELTKVSKSFYNTANEFLRDTDNYI